jgi:protein-L-isoaspartate O-methyltransferase
MQKKFIETEQAYNEFYTEIMKKGKLPIRKTKKGLWGTTECRTAFELFRRIKLSRFKNFLDLGSGDGKVVLIASLFTKAAGIEIDAELVRKSREMAKKLNLAARFIQGDFFSHSISKHDIIFINPDQQFSNGLEEKLLKEMKGKLICFPMVYSPQKLRKGRTYWIGQMPFTVYAVPIHK